MRLFVLLTCLTGAILAHAFNINGIEYEPSDESTVSIKSVSPSLTQIIIPEVVSYGGADYTVTTIKSRAFNSANLTSLTLPGTIVRIEDYAFNSASSLKELILLDGSSPLNIGISKHSTYYNEGMFRHTPLTTLYLGREYFTTYYNEKVLGYDANPFYAIKSLKNVTIGDVKNIHTDCFSSCENIETINFGTAVENIGSNAFNGCKALNSILLPNSVKSIDYNAFAGCNNVTSFELGNSIETIANDVFTGINADNLRLPKSLKSLSWRSFSNCKFENLIIEDTEDEVSIHSLAFSGTTFRTLYLGRNINNSSIFSGLSCLERVEIGDFITSLSDGAFMDCSNLKEIIFSKNLTYIGNYTFCRCISLKKLLCPVNLKNIGIGAFQECSSLSEIIVNNALSDIGDNGFAGCSSLNGIDMLNITTLGKGTFKNCSKLQSIRFNNTISEIPDSCFYGCLNLAEIDCHEGLKYINAFAFANCSSLKSISLPTSIIKLGNSCFENSGITTFTVPNNVLSLPKSVFYGCSALKHLYLNDSLHTIEDNAFGLCQITNVHLNNLNTWFNIEVGQKGTPFNSDGSTKLVVNGIIITEIEVPNTISVIPAYRFYGMSLNTIKIPATIKSILNNALTGVHGLQQLYFFANGEIINSIDKLPDNGSHPIIWSGTNSYNYLCNHFSDYDIRLYPIGKIANVKSWICGYDFSFEGGISSTPYTIKIFDSNFNQISEFPSNEANTYEIRNLLPGSKYTAEISYLYDGELQNYSWQFETNALWGKAVLDKCTQTTLSFKIDIESDKTVPRIEKYGSKIGDNMMWWPDKNYTYQNLNPNSSYYLYPYVQLYGVAIPLSSNSFKTKDISVTFNKDIFPNNITLRASWDAGDAKIEHFYFDGFERGIETVSRLHLKPNSTYDFKFYLITNQNYTLEYNCKVKTSDLSIDILPTKVINLGEVIVAAQTNCSDYESNVGFQWRKFDAPTSLQSSEASAITYGEMFEGIIKNLQTTSYYNVRAFYKDSDNNFYYTEWQTFDPSDFSYFTPTVRTYDAKIHENGSVDLIGYALQGSDPIINQGFEYWPKNALSRSENEVNIINTSGQIMNAHLSNLNNGEYSYRAFVETSEGYTYGDILSFSISNSGASLEDITSDKFVNTIICYFNLKGQRYNVPQKGINIILYKDGTTKKVFIK